MEAADRLPKCSNPISGGFVVALEGKFPEHVQKAFIAAEDKRFLRAQGDR